MKRAAEGGRANASRTKISSAPGRTESKLAAFWREGKFTDVVVRAGGRDFPAHRIMLAAGSEYFAVRDCEKRFADSGRADIELPNISAEVFETILTYLYEGTCSCSADVLLDVAAAAQFLQAPQLVSKVCESITAGLSITNCVERLRFAELHNLPITVECEAAVATHFKDLEPSSLCALPLSSLKEVLAADTLNAESEAEVFTVALTFARRNLASSSDEALAALFECVRFSLLPEAVFRDQVMPEPLLQGAACSRLMLAAFAASAYGKPASVRIGGMPRTPAEAMARGFSVEEALAAGITGIAMFWSCKPLPAPPYVGLEEGLAIIMSDGKTGTMYARDRDNAGPWHVLLSGEVEPTASYYLTMGSKYASMRLQEWQEDEPYTTTYPVVYQATAPLPPPPELPVPLFDD